jgi:hypothetical protein
MSFFRSVDLVKVSYAPGDWVKGSWVEGKPARTDFKGSWQAASGQALQVLPDGKRNREAYKVFAPIELDFTAADEERKVSGDRIIWEGKEYEVSAAAKWNNGLISHWELICTRVPPKAKSEDEAE